MQGIDRLKSDPSFVTKDLEISTTVVNMIWRHSLKSCAEKNDIVRHAMVQSDSK